jgi:hypothetical protein
VATGSYYRNCRSCGRRIQMRKMPHGQWVAFEGYDHQHDCKVPPSVGRVPGGHVPLRGASFERSEAGFADVTVGGVAGAGDSRRGAGRRTAPSAVGSSSAVDQTRGRGISSGQKWFAALVVAAVAIASFSTDGYWYCWNSGAAAPHHSGFVAVKGDHACNHLEVWLNGNPSRPTGR